MHDPLIESVLISLRRVIRATDLHSRDLIRTTGLTAPQLLLLQTLQTRGALSVGELAEDMRLSQATVTSILDRLEQRGYLAREKSQRDKRRVHIHLSPSGQAAIKDAPVPLQESFVRQFRDLKDWEQSMIISALQRVAEMMDAQDLDASPVLDVGTLDRVVQPQVLPRRRKAVTRKADEPTGNELSAKKEPAAKPEPSAKKEATTKRVPPVKKNSSKARK